MSITSGAFAWRGSEAEAECEAERGGQVDRFPAHSRVVLPDGDIMLVRAASLSAAKDLLAAQRAAERRLAAYRDSRLFGEVAQIVAETERASGPLGGDR
jgi:hypothetical protein